MTFTTAFLAAALVVPSMPPPEYDDCEVVTNCASTQACCRVRFPRR